MWAGANVVFITIFAITGHASPIFLCAYIKAKPCSVRSFSTNQSGINRNPAPRSEVQLKTSDECQATTRASHGRPRRSVDCGEHDRLMGAQQLTEDTRLHLTWRDKEIIRQLNKPSSCSYS
ncbi:hypothetical protein RRG08_027131 [Elysia crispata]|uniref:Uncharacterized protein n=1 Tax=Elysia crispata TaxID=231223 RepID=A0AAE1D5Q0_9GAST|nr:hypothetical protein RRG08_027131 [Elysia crispata]